MGESLIQGIGNEVLIIYCGAFLIITAICIAVNKFLPSTFVATNRFASERIERTYDSEICPICISPHRLAVETNCGHKFCGQCIQSYLNNRPSRESLFASTCLPCPMCRQNINLLLTSFSAYDSVDEAERREITSIVYEYNIRYGRGPRSWMTYLRDCPVLIRHMLSEFSTAGGLVFMFQLRIVVCILIAAVYLLSPVDIIPEAGFGFFGLADDIFIIYAFAVYISIMYRRYVLSRANEGDM